MGSWRGACFARTAERKDTTNTTVPSGKVGKRGNVERRKQGSSERGVRDLPRNLAFDEGLDHAS